MESPDFMTALLNQPETVLVLVTLIVFFFLVRSIVRPAADAYRAVSDRQDKSIEKMEDGIEKHSEALVTVVKLAQASVDALAIVVPASNNTLHLVQNIEGSVAQIHQDLSIKPSSVENLLAEIADTTRATNQLLSGLREEMATTNTKLDEWASGQVAQSDIENLRGSIEAFASVVADVKASQSKLMDSAVHIAKYATGEHAVLTVEEEPAA